MGRPPKHLVGVQGVVANALSQIGRLWEVTLSLRALQACTCSHMIETSHPNETYPQSQYWIRKSAEQLVRIVRGDDV